MTWILHLSSTWRSQCSVLFAVYLRNKGLKQSHVTTHLATSVVSWRATAAARTRLCARTSSLRRLRRPSPCHACPAGPRSAAGASRAPEPRSRVAAAAAYERTRPRLAAAKAGCASSGTCFPFLMLLVGGCGDPLPPCLRFLYSKYLVCTAYSWIIHMGHAMRNWRHVLLTGDTFVLVCGIAPKVNYIFYAPDVSFSNIFFLIFTALFLGTFQGRECLCTFQ